MLSEEAELFLNTTIVQQTFLQDLLQSYNDYFIPRLKNKKIKVKDEIKRNFVIYYFFYCSVCINKSTKVPILKLDNLMLVTLDVRNKKPRIFFSKNDKNVFSLTSGIVLKQLDIKEKNFKKNTRILNVMVKSSIIKMQKDHNFTNFVFILKGTKYFFYKLMVFLKNCIDLNKVIFLYSPNISRGRIKFKKLKSIKRNLIKKNLKLIK